MTFDPIHDWNTTKKRGSFLLCAAICAILFGCACAIEFYRQYCNNFTDIYLHAQTAAGFDFSDLHSITCRISYPAWHLMTAALTRLGMSLGASATLVTTVMKALCFFFTSILLYLAMPEDSRRPWLCLSLSLIIHFVTPVRISSINPNVYFGVGSTTLWHNPTQQTVNAVMLVLVPWICHCRAEFDRMESEGIDSIRLPAWKVIVLVVLAFGSVACKPTVMQCLLPAAFVWFLVLLIRKPKHIRFYLQMILAFLPAGAYFLLNWLYYTGVVVEYTSGAEFIFSIPALLVRLRSALMMGLCPLLLMLSVCGKRLRNHPMLTLSLLMIAFAVPEAAWFFETGERSGHGNFTWALNSAMLMFWVSAVCAALREIPALKKLGEWNPVRRLFLWCAGAAGLWHIFSGLYYLIYLWKSGNSF